jgi:RNA polymerase sigma factor (sigma-70 family)
LQISGHKTGMGGEEGVNLMQTAIAMENKQDRDLFSEMAREHHRGLLVYARALLRDENEARDLVQESLLAAWKTMARFDVTRDPGAWLRGIVRHKWKDHCRRLGRRPAIAESELGELEALIVQATEGGGGEAVFAALKECRDKLPAPFAEAVDHFYYGGLSGEEAARELGIQAGTLRKRLERARQALRECLERTEESTH